MPRHGPVSYTHLVAQMLIAKGNNLFYYTMKSETSNHLSEIDFLTYVKAKICPLEVNSGNYRTQDVYKRQLPALINLDFADVQTVMKDKGMAHIDVYKRQAINRLGMKYASQDQIVYYSVDKNNYMDQYSDIPE